ncbi:MAG: SpoIIE family protein phosphatase [Candidatus Accumulibacter sp.]|jgi:sigma-B regulation protein RsbU (phosphoserine phosphatase)|nr:SpoIIE family protein phosphatase [Accumulibacter sp.]
MNLFSLRAKMIVLLTGILLLLGASIVYISKRDVTANVSELERRAVQNTVRIVAQDIMARWHALLGEKIIAVRDERVSLMDAGAMAMSVLRDYADRVNAGQMSLAEAQIAAMDWIGRQDFRAGRLMLVCDQDYKVRASSSAALLGTDMSNSRIISGYLLGSSIQDELQRKGYAFAIYNSQLPGEEVVSHYGYFVYFAPWDWRVLIADNSQAISAQATWQKGNMEAEVGEILAGLKLSRNGFMFIVNGSGAFVVPPPETFATTMHDTENSAILRKALEQTADMARAPFGILDIRWQEIDWYVEYKYIRPLDWTLVAMVPARDFVQPAEQLVSKQSTVFALILLLALAGAMLLVSQLMRPLARLAEFVRHLPERNWLDEADIPPDIVSLAERRRDEAGLLTTAFLGMVRQLRENIARLVEETGSRERIEGELSIARDIQQGLLPTSLDAVAARAVDLHVSATPAKEVGGDLCDYFLLADKRLCLAVGDVSGKGMPAALFMVITQTLIHASAEDLTDPAQMMWWLNQRLSENNPNLMFVTLFLGVLNLENGELVWVNAGHPPPLLLSADGRVTPLAGRSGIACGVREGVSFRPLATRLARGDMILIYTDGVTEAIDRAQRQYGEARLQALLQDVAEMSAQAVVRRVLDDVETFTAGLEAFDDITLMAVRWL